MKVIFLDIDGVLNTEAWRNSTEEYFDKPISEEHMYCLRYLVEHTGAKIVLSSTWREEWNEGNTQASTIGAYLNKTFAEHNLKIYAKTPELPGNNRNDEIIAFLADHCVENYVVLDDVDTYGFDEKHFVKTSDNGLDERAVEKAIKILSPDYSEPINIDEQWLEVRALMRDAVGEDTFNVWLKGIYAKTFFPDSKMLVLYCNSFVRRIITDSEPLSDVLDKAIREVFGEVEYNFEDEDIGIDNASILTSDIVERTAARRKIVYNPYLAYENPDVRAFKMREDLRRMVRMHPKLIFKSENVEAELIYRLILIFVNAAEAAGITDYIKISKRNRSIEIYSKDQTEFLIDKVATEKQLYNGCDAEKHLVRNLERKIKFTEAPFHVRSSVKSLPSEGDIFAATDSYLTLFALVNKKNTVLIQSVKEGYSTSVLYEHGISKGVEKYEVNKPNGTYIIFEASDRTELSNDEICAILEKTAALSGVKTSFYDYEEEDCFTYSFKNIEDYLKKHIPETNTGFCFGKIKADGKDRFDKHYYNAEVELAFTLVQEGIAKTYSNYSLLPDENVFSKEFYSKLKDRLNSWLSEKTSRGILTTEEVKKLTSFVLNIKTDHDYEEVSLTRKKSPKFKRMVDDMIEVLLDNEFDYWLTHNQGEVIRLIFDIFNNKDEEIKENMFPDGMK